MAWKEVNDQTADAPRTLPETRAWANVAADTWCRQTSQGTATDKASQTASGSKSAETSLPGLTICEAGKQSQKPLADRLEDQKDRDIGTTEHPVNENCQTTAVKNAFHFYGKDCDAAKVRPEMEKMLNAISQNNGKGIDSDAVGKAFDHNEVNHFTPDQVKEAVKSGDLTPFVAQEPDQPGKAYVNPEAMTAYLAEKGCQPEAVKLGNDAAAAKVKQALDDGKPVIFEDKNTHVLYQEQEHAAKGTPYEKMGGKVSGHTYMAYKDKNDGNYYVMDNTHKPVKVSEEVLQKKLHDQNSAAIIVNKPPDGKFLDH